MAGPDGIVTLTYPQVRALMTTRVIAAQSVAYGITEPGRTQVLAQADAVLRLIGTLEPDAAEPLVQSLEAVAEGWRTAKPSTATAATPVAKPSTTVPPVGGAKTSAPVVATSLAPALASVLPSRKGLYLGLGAVALGVLLVGWRK